MVNIKDFCKECKYANTKANESPCKECMEHGIFKGNAMPLYYEKWLKS